MERLLVIDPSMIPSFLHTGKAMPEEKAVDPEVTIAAEYAPLIRYFPYRVNLLTTCSEVFENPKQETTPELVHQVIKNMLLLTGFEEERENNSFVRTSPIVADLGKNKVYSLQQNSVRDAQGDTPTQSFIFIEDLHTTTVSEKGEFSQLPLITAKLSIDNNYPDDPYTIEYMIYNNKTDIDGKCPATGKSISPRSTNEEGFVEFVSPNSVLTTLQSVFDTFTKKGYLQPAIV